MGSRVMASAGAAIVCLLARAAPAQNLANEEPFRLLVQPDYDSVYAPPDPISANTGVNEGGVHFQLDVSYMSDYVYRGINESNRIAAARAIGDTVPRPEFRETAANIQVDAHMTFDLGKAPHPFVGVFVNTFDADPESRFQEIRPFLGFELTLRPIIFTAGHNSYIYPDRDQLNTTEVFGKITLDDSYFLRTDDPILSPYIYAAYDYDLYDAVYLEAGVEHRFILEGTGIVLTAQASVAWVNGHELYVQDGAAEDAGFHHYQLGLIGSYRLNPLLNIPQRYGDWMLKGYLFYTDGIENDLRADTELWGGAGIGFRY
ncbi:MAG TPA: hypothetical protein VGR35_14925 [Tepidisphaeraceae bacterium]|nr:hypothetical protein [Tepidisphaeraceae bacterium]